MDRANNAPIGVELDWIEQIAALIGPPHTSEIWVGDDAAVIEPPENGRLLFCTDLIVQGVHFDFSICGVADVGWKAMAVNLSDIAAMGGKPRHAVVSVVGAGSFDLGLLYRGLLEAGTEYRCQVVGGDLSAGANVVISVAVIGETTTQHPVRRHGANPGDGVFVTGVLGSSAAGLRLLRADISATGPAINAYRRPIPRLAAGASAARGGATAMIDVSDGFGLDLHRLALSSAVGFAIGEIPIASGATAEEALAGGEDYELIFTAPDEERIIEAFTDSDLARPYRIGHVVEQSAGVTLSGKELPASGYVHH